MIRAASVVCLALVWATSAGATALDVYENSLGGPGLTAGFPAGNGLIAELVFDADSAEGGSGLPFGGPSEIEFVPTGDAIFNAFTCQLAGCAEGSDYVFTAGGAGVGSLIVSDPTSTAQTGIIDIGLLDFDFTSLTGTIELLGCNYTDGNAVERQCSPFTVATAVPEPGTGLLLGGGLALLGAARRRLR